MTKLTPESIIKTINKRSFANIASVSEKGRSHVAGVVYDTVGTDLYVNTFLTSRKARNIAHSSMIALSIPVRRVPVGPPSLIQFQTTAVLIEKDEAQIERLLDGGYLDGITGHGLEHPDVCFIRIPLPRRVTTHGLGMSLLQWIRDPIEANNTVDLTDLIPDDHPVVTPTLRR